MLVSSAEGNANSVHDMGCGSFFVWYTKYASTNYSYVVRISTGFCVERPDLNPAC